MLGARAILTRVCTSHIAQPQTVSIIVHYSFPALARRTRILVKRKGRRLGILDPASGKIVPAVPLLSMVLRLSVELSRLSFRTIRIAAQHSHFCYRNLSCSRTNGTPSFIDFVYSIPSLATVSCLDTWPYKSILLSDVPMCNMTT